MLWYWSALLSMDSGKVLLILQKGIGEYQQKKADYEAYIAELSQLKETAGRTKDGQRVELVGKIGSPADVEGVLNNGGEGVGLYRTEFLYMDSDVMPDEEKQFAAYKTVIESFKGGAVIIRTLDIGGDKKLPYLPLPEEMNPFLGLRAIRLCFERPEMFKTQLRAILRASAYGTAKIMFPMISGIGEVRQAKEILAECMAELDAEGVAYDKGIGIGIMVEFHQQRLPRILCQGSGLLLHWNNDLAIHPGVDRMNQTVSYLYDPPSGHFTVGA